MKKIGFLVIFLMTLSAQAQKTGRYYNSGNTTTKVKYVGAMWLPGTIVLANGTELKGQVRGSSYVGNNIRSFKYRSQKGEKALVFKAEQCRLVRYDDLIVLSMPKNMKKKSGKRRFYVAMYYGEYLTVLQDPDANVATGSPGSIIFNKDQQLSFLVLKDGVLQKFTKMRFRKPFLKLCKDNAKFVARASNKKWFNYNNIYKIAHYYNQTR